MAGFAEIAVPIPLYQALTYSVPDRWRALAQVGCRARVRVGKRRLVGVIVALREEPPQGFEVRPLEEVIDLVPIVDRALLELAEFASDYYVAPIGEVLRGVVPGNLISWGSRSVRITDGGALAPPGDPEDAAILQQLLNGGPTRVADLQTRLELPDLPERLARLARKRHVRLESSGRPGGARYLSAIELNRGEIDQHLEACGRSEQGRRVVQYLAGLGRPATVKEVCAEVDCGSGVIRRLHGLGVLRRFTQIERLSLERHVLGGDGAGRERLELRPDQARAFDRLSTSLRNQRFSPFLLSGMTGSGKTEVYLRAAEQTLEAGRSVILMVPEIALVPALARAVRERFGDRVAILHSNLGRAERQQEWERLRDRHATVVLGPRSVVFAPVTDLGLIVVDEEHDGAYKQETQPRYHGRDLALVRARSSEAVAVLTSATPSLETRLNVERERFEELKLTQRVGHGALPEGVLVDLRKERFARRPGEIHFSEALIEEVTRALEEGGQVILLRNRRGYAPLLLCRACGEDYRCEDCGLPMTYHRRERQLLCHYCGERHGVPRLCRKCGEGALEPVGAGTERVEERFRERFPEVMVDVLDRDVARRRGGSTEVLDAFRRGDTRVLIGTQMVSKGHHFPNVALTGVLSADTYLGFPDFRAVEKTYSLLVQLAGRAGRGERPGRVVIQTFNPDHYAIRAALEHDDTGFASEEMRFRRVFHYPPFTRMVQLLLRDRDRQRGERRMAELARDLQQHPSAAALRISGPAPAPLERLRGEWRFQIVLRGPNGRQLRELVRAVVVPRATGDLSIDIDPHDLL